VFGKEVSELQENVVVGTNAITGTLNYVEDYTEFSSKPSEQQGNYLVLNLADNDFTDVTSVKVGLRPTYKSGAPVDDDSGLVELINDPDKNIVLLVHDTNQIVKVVQTNGTKTKTQTFSLTGLTLENE